MGHGRFREAKDKPYEVNPALGDEFSSILNDMDDMFDSLMDEMIDHEYDISGPPTSVGLEHGPRNRMGNTAGKKGKGKGNPKSQFGAKSEQGLRVVNSLLLKFNQLWAMDPVGEAADFMWKTLGDDVESVSLFQ